jgi:glycosyltransferase involved in cell wall biosynthesis
MVRRHVCVSPEVASFSKARGGLPDEKIVVIPNGVDVERFANAEAADLSQFGIPDGSTTLLFVGRLDAQKDPFRLLEAALGLLRAHRELQVLMVGEGPLRDDICSWITQHQLEENIHLSGWRDDIPALMRAADCFVLCSRWEGMPNVVLEAMAAALPVVTTQVEGTSALIEHHQTGILVPPKSTAELAGAIALVLSDPAQARVMGSAAQDVVRKEFTWSGMVAAYDELYASLL